ERICNYLRKEYKYCDDRDVVFPKDRELVDWFLFQRKQGACGPFASAFTVMCRSVGIPARVVGGFSPGDLDAANGAQAIYGRHSHAWSEVYVPNRGWVPFDATPDGV